MKVLSKYLKVALCFMAFALCSFMFAFTPTYTAVQASEMAINSYNVAINALKMPTEEVNYEDGDEFNVPLLSASLGTSAPTGYTIRVVDPAGYQHNYVVDGTNSDSFFGGVFTATQSQAEEHNLVEGNKYLTINAKNDGEYKVMYIVSEGIDEAKRTYYSNTYRVTVTNVSYELDFSTPVIVENADAAADEDRYSIVGYNKNLIKTTIPTSTVSKYELPIAYAKMVGEDLTIDQTTGKITNETATVKVTFSPQDGKYTDDVVTKETDANGVTRYSISPTEEGIYTVEYAFEQSANRPTKTYTIVVEDNYQASNLKLATTPTMPKIELGQTVELPALTVNAGDNKNVEVDVVSVKIEKEGSNGEVVYLLENNNLEFEMVPENFSGVDSYEDMVGNYRITYLVKDAYGKELTETFRVDGVTVSTAPTIKLSYNYDLITDSSTGIKSVDSDSVVFGAETELKAEYSKDGEFVLPAVYVEDAVTRNFEDFIIIRTIRKGGTYYFVDNYEYNEEDGTYMDNEDNKITTTHRGFNASGDPNIGDPTKAVKFKFNTEVATNVTGTFYLEYKVISKEVKERSSSITNYSFEVKNSLSTYTEPTITITNLKDSSIKQTDKLTVKVNAVDGSNIDLRLKNVVFTHGATTGKTETGLKTFEDYLEYVAGNLEALVGSNKYCHILDDERLISGWDNEGNAVENPADAQFKGLAYYFNDVDSWAESETKNAFDVNLSNAKDEINVVAATLNDGGMINTDTKVLTIKDTTDAQEPEINIYADKLANIWKDGSNITEFKVGQGKEVTLPSVYVVDADKTLSLNVMYYIDSPESSDGLIQYMSPSNKYFYYDDIVLSGDSETTEVQVIDGGTITTSATGIYYVVYTATDVAGNSSVMYFTFEVQDTSKPNLTVEPVADEITIAGNTVTGAKGSVIDFETTLKSADGKLDYTKDADITITIDDKGRGLDYQLSGNSKTSYRFNDVGTYTVTISASYTRVDDDMGTTETSDDVTTKLDADNKVITVVIEKQEIKWLGEFDITEYAEAGATIKLPDVAASNDAVVKVTYIAPNDSSDEAVDATKVVDNGYSYWTFVAGDETANGTYTVIYTATTEDDVLTKELKIKVGDNIAPTLTYNAGDLTQKLVYDGTNAIDYVLEVNKKAKTFVVKVINNGKEIISQDINLKISDNDDTQAGSTANMNWTNLSYELTGDNVTKGETSTSGNVETTYYTINGAGSYSLKFRMKDSSDNVNDRESIDFKVVTKATVKNNNDTVVGAVLIVISLVLLAGVILFFTFTGKKGGNKTAKTKAPKTKTTKVKVTETKTVEVVEEAQDEENVVEEKTEDEPKTGDFE